MSNTDSTDVPTRVAIALIAREGSYLIRQRPAGSIMAGVWEFPGGKLEPGESFVDAAIRECREEAGLEVEVVRERERVSHRYPHGLIDLCFLDCRTIDERADPVDGSGFVWATPSELKGLRFPGANESVIASLVAEAGAAV